MQMILTMENLSFLNFWNNWKCLPSTIATNVETRSTQPGAGGYDTEQIPYEDSRARTKAPEITFTTRLKVIFFFQMVVNLWNNLPKEVAKVVSLDSI